MRKLLLAFFCVFAIVANATPIDELLERIDKEHRRNLRLNYANQPTTFLNSTKQEAKLW